MRIVVPVGGAAAVTLSGTPVLSKRHGMPELRLHAALAFDEQQPTPPSLDVAQVRVIGSHPALIFEDAGAAAERALSLVKPRGAPEVHLLGGRLLLDDATDARWSCGGGGGGANRSGGLNSSEPLATLKLASASGAVLELTQDGAGSTVALAISAGSSAGSAALTVRGAARLMVDGTDVVQRQRRCASATDA